VELADYARQVLIQFRIRDLLVKAMTISLQHPTLVEDRQNPLHEVQAQEARLPSNTNLRVDRVERHGELKLRDLQGVSMIQQAFGSPILVGAAMDRDFAPFLGDEDVGFQ
jgi:hypothetical protein